MKCIYHDDLDGRCAASLIATYETNTNEADFIPVDYTKSISTDTIGKGEKVFILDVSFTEATLNELDNILNITDNVIWIDHHISTMKTLSKFPEYNRIKGIRSTEASAAALTYMYLYGIKFINDLPPYIQYISDYDCWIYHFGDESKCFKLGIEHFPHGPLDIIWTRLSSTMFNPVVQVKTIMEKGTVIFDFILNSNNSQLDTSFEATIEGYSVLLYNGKPTNSWLFDKIISQYDIACSYYYDGNMFHYSIYSEKEHIDCSIIAEKYGGGGHKKAAGFRLDSFIFSES